VRAHFDGFALIRGNRAKTGGQLIGAARIEHKPGLIGDNQIFGGAAGRRSKYRQARCHRFIDD
jgi:hypothetical protein